MSFPITHRVNKAFLQNYIGEVVRIAGKIIQMDSQQAVMESSDKQQVTIQLDPACIAKTLHQNYMEIVGRVNNDLSISELTAFSMGNNFDLDNYNSLVLIREKKGSQIFFD